MISIIQLVCWLEAHALHTNCCINSKIVAYCCLHCKYTARLQLGRELGYCLPMYTHSLAFELTCTHTRMNGTGKRGEKASDTKVVCKSRDLLRIYVK